MRRPRSPFVHEGESPRGTRPRALDEFGGGGTGWHPASFHLTGGTSRRSPMPSHSSEPSERPFTADFHGPENNQRFGPEGAKKPEKNRLGGGGTLTIFRPLGAN